MAQHITLSTVSGYPANFVRSEDLNIIGHDAFISINFLGESRNPVVTLVGFTVSAVPSKPKPVINVGDYVYIGDVTYELVCKKTRFPGNGDLTLVPAK